MPKTHYLFSSDAVRIYDEEGFEALVNAIKGNITTFSTFEFEEGITPSEHLLDAYDGWGKYTTITELEYLTLNEIDEP